MGWMRYQRLEHKGNECGISTISLAGVLWTVRTCSRASTRRATSARQACVPAAQNTCTHVRDACLEACVRSARGDATHFCIRPERLGGGGARDIAFGRHRRGTHAGTSTHQAGDTY
eukprot:4240788-Pleurochrysis_carterae.AAC.1